MRRESAGMTPSVQKALFLTKNVTLFLRVTPYLKLENLASAQVPEKYTF
jgi:hypothetical protein